MFYLGIYKKANHGTNMCNLIKPTVEYCFLCIVAGVQYFLIAKTECLFYNFPFIFYALYLIQTV